MHASSPSRGPRARAGGLLVRALVAEAAGAREDASASELRAFGRRLVLRRLPLCSEIRLWLLGDDIDLEADCDSLQDQQLPPYWAFCWGSGQALARFLLDHPGQVRSRRVVDFGAGCAVAAIAAALAGARSVWAVDSDPAARRAARVNAATNGVEIEVANCLPSDWDVLLASDVLYEPANRDRLLDLCAPDRRVIVGDPERPTAPQLTAELLARMDVRTLPDVDSPVRSAAVFLLVR